MKLLFKQRLFSWFDSYDIYDEAGNTVYAVKGQLSWGHKLAIYDAYGNEVGMVVQKVLTFLPKFEIYKNGSYIGCLSKEFSFLTPHYNIDYKMHKAANLLVSTSLSVKEIANNVGYEDQLVFSKAFKKKFGMSPKNYKTHKEMMDKFNEKQVDDSV